MAGERAADGSGDGAGGSAPLFDAMLARRLPERSRAWLRERCAEIAAGVSDERFAGLLSLASRFAPRAELAPDAAERRDAERVLPGFSPERWTLLEALRVRLVLARPDLADESFAKAFEECFRYADEGELRALYRALAHLPRGERFRERAAEGCRSNMRPVFEAVACDTPYPACCFDDLAWRQLVIKAVFIGAPLSRVHGLDARLSPELARMALDFADERRSAGRPVPPALWLCLGSHGGARGRAALERELRDGDAFARRAAAFGLARAGLVARDGPCDAAAFRELEEEEERD